MKEIAEFAAGLSPKKRELLDLLLRERKGEPRRTKAAPEIRRIGRDGGELLQLAFGQERLWFVHQFEPQRAAYRIPAAVRMVGPLRVAAMEWSLNEIVRRHETLRSSFKARQGRPYVDVAPKLRLALPVADLRPLPETERIVVARELVAQGADEPFDLEKGPLFRLRLLRLGDEDHVLLLVMDHTITDTWSVGVFIREMAALYEARCQGRPSPLPELPIQYVDFAHWQRRYLEGGVLAAQIEYWKRQLAGVSPVLELPTDRPRPAVHNFRGARHYITLGTRLTESVKTFSQRGDASPFMTLLSALAALLFRYTGQSDLLVGTSFSNRNRSQLEGLIGFFVNTLVLRVRASGRPTFRQLVAQVRETTLAAFAHSDVPIERLVEELHLGRDMSRNPLWQVDFAFQNAPMPRLDATGLELSRFEIEERASRFDLEIDLRETPNGYTGWFGYNKELFEPPTIARMAEHFERLLAGALAAPDEPVASLSLRSEDELRALQEWSGTAAASPQVGCVHRLFTAQAARTPDAVALSSGDARLSYGQLNRRANQLAHHLRARGVGPEARVALCLERGLDMVVAILGVLKAGAAYVPLDPTYPAERLEFQLADVEARILVTQESLRRMLPAAPEVVCLDADGAAIARESGEDPLVPDLSPDHLVYVIYTSGSTGRPKGALVTHGNVTRLFTATAERFGFCRADVWTLFHSYGFDFSVWELWGALLYGGRLVVVPYWVSRSPEAFRELLRDERVTVLNQTPSAFFPVMRAECSAEDAGGLPLRLVIFGGESLEVHSLRPWLELYGDLSPRLVNGYGITETTVFVNFRPLAATDLERAARSLLGERIPDLQVYVLDGELEPAPIGVPGEMYIGGPGVARGYFRRHELTAERFVPHPWSRLPGDRLYRSGDLARWLPSGELHYLGRSDHQVKVRGFRIELGEIEAALLRCPGVRETVVIADGEADDAQRLIAYLVVSAEWALGDAELRERLRRTLPEPMVPAVLVRLDALPLTANGKVDRRALPPPDRTEHERDAQRESPRTPTEELLAEIWADVLGRSAPVGVRDNFFDVGGHSLLGTQVVSRIRDTFGVELSLQGLFQKPTLESLAEAIDALRNSGQAGATAPPIEPVPRHGPPPLSFAQERLWFIHQLNPAVSAYNIPGAVRLKGPLDTAALARTFEEIIRRHEVLRTTFATADGQPVQLIHPSLPLELLAVDLRAVSADRREPEAYRLAKSEALRPFDLARGPLIRGILLRLAEGEHLLVLNVHHIVYDMWSRAVFVRELGVLYQAFARGEPSPLPPLRIQYADFAHWQRRWLQDEVLESHLSYWREQLKGIPPALELPADRPRPLNASFAGARTFFGLTPELTSGLKQLSRDHGVTPFIALLAGFAALLARSTGQEDIVVGSPIANRNRSEIEGLMGFFANTLVLRNRVPGNLPFQELLGNTREVALGAYAHQDLAFEKLVGELQPARSYGRNPLVQVVFNFLQNYQPPNMVLGDLTLAAEWVHNGAAAFDFTLSMWEVAGRFQGTLDYSTELFNAATADRILESFATLLAAAAANPQRRIAELPLMSAAQRDQALAEAGRVQAHTPKHPLLHAWFEIQAGAVPDAVALVSGNELLTYGALNRRANRLAHHLRARGVGPDVRVGLCLERGLEMVVAILAVLKAGGAYLPLDPTYPADRLGFQLADAGARVLVTQEPLRGIVPEAEEIVRLDTDAAAIAQEDGENLVDPGLCPDHLAYVIYTSGSTGQPKGVLVTHRNVTRLFAACQGLFGFRADDAWSLFHSYAFDFSVWEVWGGLLHGGRVVVVPYWVSRSPEAFRELLRAERITVLSQTPSAFFPLMHAERSALEAEDLALRLVIFGGESLEARSLQPWLERYGDRTPRLINGYGITETTVFVNFRAVEPGDLVQSARSLLGEPIPDLQVYVLDGELEPAPLGVPGEMYIGGAGLARGYLHSPELTAERFIPHPWSRLPGDRIYRSGDLARRLPSGGLQYLGRSDHQVKVRGFRIELGEIEAALADFAGVAGGAVAVRETRAGDSYLVAYAVPIPGEPLKVEELRRFLGRKLPDHMIPSALVTLDALPLSPTGKVDRRALQRLEVAALAAETPSVPPRTDLEKTLAGLWADLLEIEPQRIGVHDSFFQLGGHSLLTTRLLSRLREAFELDVDLPSFFDNPTVAGLAEVIEVTRWMGEGEERDDASTEYEECEL